MAAGPEDSSIDRVLGQKVRARREELDLSQQELAWRGSISAATIQDIEVGRRRMTPPQVLALSEALGVTVSWFFEGS